MKNKEERMVTAASTDARILKESTTDTVLLISRSLAMYGVMLVVVSAVMQSLGQVTLLDYYYLLSSLEKTGFLLATAAPVVCIAGFGYEKV